MADVHWQKEELAKILDLAMATVDEKIIPEIVDDMKRLAPVDTGELRDSIEAVGDGKIVIGADHAAYVEFGTEIMAAQPYARPALYRERSG